VFAVADLFEVLRGSDGRPVRRFLPLWNGLMLRFVFIIINSPDLFYGVAKA